MVKEINFSCIKYFLFYLVLFQWVPQTKDSQNSLKAVVLWLLFRTAKECTLKSAKGGVWGRVQEKLQAWSFHCSLPTDSRLNFPGIDMWNTHREHWQPGELTWTWASKAFTAALSHKLCSLTTGWMSVPSPSEDTADSIWPETPTLNQVFGMAQRLQVTLVHCPRPPSKQRPSSQV